ncbi:hypothetical protein K6025_01985 [Ehrlichia sp. JZT12]
MLSYFAKMRLKDLTNRVRTLAAPSFMDNLKQFNLREIRNTQYLECTNGEQAWKDLTRDPPCIINGKIANFNTLITQYNANNPNPPQGNQCRKVLYEMFNSTFNQICGQKVEQSLVNECITLFNQTSLHGSLNLGLMQHISKDIQQRICPHTTVYPAISTFNTIIQVISYDTLRICYREQTDYRDSESRELICSLNGTLSFNVTAITSNDILYHNPTISIDAPLPISSKLFKPRYTIITNILAFFMNGIRRLRSYITNTPVQKTPNFEITQQDSLARLTYNLASNYRCQAITNSEEGSTEEQLTEEKNTQESEQTKVEPQKMFSSRSSYNIPTIMNNLKVEAQEVNNNKQTLSSK